MLVPGRASTWSAVPPAILAMHFMGPPSCVALTAGALPLRANWGAFGEHDGDDDGDAAGGGDVDVEALLGEEAALPGHVDGRVVGDQEGLADGDLLQGLGVEGGRCQEGAEEGPAGERHER